MEILKIIAIVVIVNVLLLIGSIGLGRLFAKYKWNITLLRLMILIMVGVGVGTAHLLMDYILN